MDTTTVIGIGAVSTVAIVGVQYYRWNIMVHDPVNNGKVNGVFIQWLIGN